MVLLAVFFATGCSLFTRFDDKGDSLLEEATGGVTGGVTETHAPGSLDLSFDADGKVVTPVSSSNNDLAQAVAIQSDGKIVVAGNANTGGSFDFAVARYNADGSLDAMPVIDLGSPSDEAYAVAIQSDGKIVVAGTTYIGTTHDFTLLRLNADVTPDTSFGMGIVITDFGYEDYGNAMAIDSDGKIVVVGHSNNGADDFAVARYWP